MSYNNGVAAWRSTQQTGRKAPALLQAMLLEEGDEELTKATIDTMGHMCDYISEDAEALASIYPRLDNFRFLVPLIACALPRQGALWLAEELAKQVPTMLFHENGQASSGGIACILMLINISVRLLSTSPPCATTKGCNLGSSDSSRCGEARCTAGCVTGCPYRCRAARGSGHPACFGTLCASWRCG